MADNKYAKKIYFYNGIRKDCEQKDIECVEDVVTKFNETFDYLYIERVLEMQKDNTLYQSIKDSPNYKSVYTNPEVEVFKKILSRQPINP